MVLESVHPTRILLDTPEFPEIIQETSNSQRIFPVSILEVCHVPSELPTPPESPAPSPKHCIPEINIKIIRARAFQLLLESGETCFQYFTQHQAFSLSPKSLSMIQIV